MAVGARVDRLTLERTRPLHQARDPLGLRASLAPADFIGVCFRKDNRCAERLGQRREIHLADLHDLSPTEKEIEGAIRWIERLPGPHRRIRVELKRIVEELGYEDLAYYITT